MDRPDDHLPDDLNDIARRLVESREDVSGLELDTMRQRVQQRVRRAPRQQSRMGRRLRRNAVATALTSALLMTVGTGAVLACWNYGGSTFPDQKDPKESAGCVYHGPYVWTFSYASSHSKLTVTVTYDCKKVKVTFYCPRGITKYGFSGGSIINTRNATTVSPTPPRGMSFANVTFDGKTVSVPMINP
jgi:hypothetical protein